MERGKAKMPLVVGPFALFCCSGGSGGTPAHIAT